MLKKTKNSKKLGRHQIISPEELFDRYKALKRFLEDNWGRIGLDLPRVRQPEDVRMALKLVPGVEWCRPFREQPAVCLLEYGTTKVGRRALSLTRQQHKDAVATEGRLWSEYHSTRQKAEEATTALKAVISQFEAAIGLFPFFFVVALIARELGVQELTTNSNRLEASSRLAQKKKQRLTERLSSQEGWYAQNEIVRFARSKRYDRTPINFAKAMAGLPQYGWLHSLRKCPIVEDETPFAATLNYQLFELLETTIKRVKPLKLEKVEVMLKEDLLKRDHPQDLLKAHFGPSWAYIRQAFAFCAGRRFNRDEMPFRLMAKIQDNVERGKTITEIELAKREQLV